MLIGVIMLIRLTWMIDRGCINFAFSIDKNISGGKLAGWV